MEDKTKEELIVNIQDLECKYKNAEVELKKAKEELEVETWGLTKTNEAIKFIYKELDKKNKELQTLDKLKTDFISTASHELRTPLTTISEAISQVLDELHGEITSKQREFLSMCFEDINRLNRLVDDLLDMSKIEAGRFKLTKQHIDIVSLAKMVSALFRPKAQSMGLELRENFCSQAAMAYVDKDSVIRVFTNLINNAFKFTDKGYIEILVMDKPACVECCISDTGRGISEEDMPRIFGKFEEFGNREGVKEKGTGLGLSICKRIIELHQGEIWVESALNKGTKFIFTLPKYAENKIQEEGVILSE